MGLDR